MVASATRQILALRDVKALGPYKYILQGLTRAVCEPTGLCELTELSTCVRAACVKLQRCVNLRCCVECINELLIANDCVLLSGLYCTCLEMQGRDCEKISLNLQDCLRSEFAAKQGSY